MVNSTVKNIGENTAENTEFVIRNKSNLYWGEHSGGAPKFSKHATNAKRYSTKERAEYISKKLNKTFDKTGVDPFGVLTLKAAMSDGR